MGDTSEITDLTHRLPTQDEVTSAAEAATTLANAHEQEGQLTIQNGNGELVRLAPAIGDLIIELLGHVAQGNMVTLVPTGALLTTQQAADMLNVSRPHLSKLLKDGEIPFVPVGSHRRVKLEDLKAYKERRDSGRHEVLNELARMGQEFDDS